MENSTIITLLALAGISFKVQNFYLGNGMTKEILFIYFFNLEFKSIVNHKIIFIIWSFPNSNGCCLY